MSASEQRLVHDLVAAVPGLASAYDEHVADNDELLSHVFFGDVTRFAEDRFRQAEAGGAGARGELETLLDFLEARLASGDPEVENLIAVSFLENLPRPEEDGGRIRRLLGPRLSAELDAIG